MERSSGGSALVTFSMAAGTGEGPVYGYWRPSGGGTGVTGQVYANTKDTEAQWINHKMRVITKGSGARDIEISHNSAGDSMSGVTLNGWYMPRGF